MSVMGEKIVLVVSGDAELDDFTNYNYTDLKKKHQPGCKLAQP